MSCSALVGFAVSITVSSFHSVSSPVICIPAHTMWPWWEAASWAWPRPESSFYGTRPSASSCWRKKKSSVGWALNASVVVEEDSEEEHNVLHVTFTQNNQLELSFNWLVLIFSLNSASCEIRPSVVVSGPLMEESFFFFFTPFFISCAPEWAQQWSHSQRDLLHAGVAEGPSVCARGHFSLRVLRQERAPIQEMWKGQAPETNMTSHYTSSDIFSDKGIN